MLTGFFRKGIILHGGEIAGVHAILHEPIEVGIGTTDDINTKWAVILRSTVVSFPWMIPYHISRGVESTGFESIKDEVDTVNVQIVMLVGNCV